MAAMPSASAKPTSTTPARAALPSRPGHLLDEQAYCTTCGKLPYVRTDGTIDEHDQHPIMGGGRCPGSGRQVREAVQLRLEGSG